MFKKVGEISYDSATFHGCSFQARYSTDTDIELRIRSDLAGLDPEAVSAVNTDNHAKLWGLAMFGHLFWPLLPIRLRVRALSLQSDEEERCRAWFIGVLSEHLYRSGLPAELDLTFSGERLAPRQPTRGLAERAILMSGGGKDSVVCGELLKSLGIPFSWFSSRGETKDVSVREIAEISGDSPLITGVSFFESRAPGQTDFKKANMKRLRRFYFMHRKRLRRLGWLSLMSQSVEACLVAEATGSRYVLMGNERSANEGNRVRVGDIEVNHQYIKSYAFEREFAPFVAKYLHPELVHASLLMPFHELQIAKQFASYPRYFSAFRSCNRRSEGDSWCLECPKCAFVFLMLSAFVGENVLSQIFEADLLADPNLVKIFVGLCGRGGQKPFECVGTQDESRLALHLAANRRTATPLHPDLVEILPGPDEVDELRKRVLQSYNQENGIPPHWNERLREMV